MSLSDWARNGWLVDHKTSPVEIRDLLGVADRDLRDCVSKGLSDDCRLGIAYNAALQCATAALAASGDYERAGEVSKAEADEAKDLARALRKQTQEWLRQNHPELLPK